MCVYTYIHTDYYDWPFVVSHCSSPERPLFFCLKIICPFLS